MLKIRIIKKGPMTLSGSKVLKLIQDTHTPPVDLFVREVIQNCSDACLENKDHIKIMFTHKEFNIDKLSNCLEKIESNDLKEYYKENHTFLAVSDTNTTGLLGGYQKVEDGTPNNFYNLVYDIMNSKNDDTSGGSWGLGKSIYYRYGKGLCFYYSRTYENGKYFSKLAGALIQNENMEKCLLGEKSNGIAFFGDIIEDQPAPIFDENEINDFLMIFNLSPYENNTTGTIVIIPFLNEELFLENRNDDTEINRPWLTDFDESLKMAIQRWYFPRINNEKYDGKYLKIALNNSKIELNQFFMKLQSLCNKEEINGKYLDIKSKRMEDIILGTFNYKLFTKEELGIYSSPFNFPSPKLLVDSNNDVDDKGLLFYFRKPGMIVNYENQLFGQYTYDEDKYLIGVFILNDNAIYQEEKLGKYIKYTEAGNHFEWKDSNIVANQIISKKKPIKEICSIIKNILNDEFCQSKAVILDGGATILQKRLGEKLMPPSGFGKSPEETGVKGEGKQRDKKVPRLQLSFNGINDNGLLLYELIFELKQNETFICDLTIKVGGKKYSFSQWDDLGFKCPCEIKKIDICELYLNKHKENAPQIIIVDDNFSKKRKKVLNSIDIYRIVGKITNCGKAYGFKINSIYDGLVKLKILLYIIPNDNKYVIKFNSSIVEGQYD